MLEAVVSMYNDIQTPTGAGRFNRNLKKNKREISLVFVREMFAIKT